jgi:hypothetical protein
MRRIRNAVFAISFTAVSIIVGACATSEPVDGDLNGIGQETTPTLPNEDKGTSLPPSNPPSTPKDDAPVKKDAGAKDSSTQPPVDSGPTTNPGDCDPNDPLNLIKLIAVTSQGTPKACPCSAAECCFQSICLPSL